MASETKGWGLAALIGVALIAAQAAAELAMGRPAICTCGTVLLWYGDLFGPGLSQHIADWYSFTHISHGFVFYAFTKIAAPRAPFWTRLAATLVLEVSWEVVENTPVIIDRYRQSALAQGYNGDSVVNSVSDTLFCVLGFWLAWRLPVRWSLAFVVINEIALAGSSMTTSPSMCCNSSIRPRRCRNGRPRAAVSGPAGLFDDERLIEAEHSRSPSLTPDFRGGRRCVAPGSFRVPACRAGGPNGPNSDTSRSTGPSPFPARQTAA